MTNRILPFLALYYGATAAFLIIAPQSFYEIIPGVADTGPFNSHFARDVGFAFLISAIALYLGSQRHDRTLALIGAGFPGLHGLFHLVSITHHMHSNALTIAADLIGTSGIAILTLFTVSQIKGACK